MQVWTKSPRSQPRVQRSEFLYPRHRPRLADAPNLRSLRATPAHLFWVRVWETGKLTADKTFHGQERDRQTASLRMSWGKFRIPLQAKPRQSLAQPIWVRGRETGKMIADEASHGQEAPEKQHPAG
jgi:hypothetical protein